MDLVAEKLTSVSGDVVSGINKTKDKERNKNRQVSSGQQQQQQQQQPQAQQMDIQLTPSSISMQPKQRNPSVYSEPRSAQHGFLFGGESFSFPRSNQNQPPGIGFRPEYLKTAPSDDGSGDARKRMGSRELNSEQQQISSSNESLYKGDAWSRLWFQRVMLLTLIRLMIFIRKVYEDYHATKQYGKSSVPLGHYLISVSTLLLPTIVFTVYRVSRYLQLALPEIRSLKQPASQLALQQGESHDTQEPTKLNTRNSSKLQTVNDDPQAARALMDARCTKTSGGIQLNEDDGLVTARQSPANFDEFHDSKSQHDRSSINLNSQRQSVSPTPSATVANVSASIPEAPTKESVDVEKLGYFSDKETVRIVIGTSEQLLHGVLYIFWQLKRQVDVVGFLVERACLWRQPKKEETQELDRLRTGSDGLEWFQDFYAAFLAIVAQIYVLGLESASISGSSQSSRTNEQLVRSNLNAVSNSPSDPSGSGATRLVGNVIHQFSGGQLSNPEDLKITSEIIVSVAVVFSLLIAVRRRDDGPLTFALSILGWGSIFASRIIIIAFSFVHIGWKIMLVFLTCHVFGMTAWLYKISLDSHNDVEGESEENQWDIEAANQSEVQARDTDNNNDLDNKEQVTNSSKITETWSKMEHAVLLVQILTLFALPSLFYWPIMFNLKLHCRPFKYLVLILIQNFVLIPSVWLKIPSSSPSQLYFLGAVGAFSIAGFVFVSLYVSCKPNLTEYFARADELFNEAERSGIYYEFCSRIFKLPDLSKHAFKRLMNQSIAVEEVEVQS